MQLCCDHLAVTLIVQQLDYHNVPCVFYAYFVYACVGRVESTCVGTLRGKKVLNMSLPSLVDRHKVRRCCRSYPFVYLHWGRVFDNYFSTRNMCMRPKDWRVYALKGLALPRESLRCSATPFRVRCL